MVQQLSRACGQPQCFSRSACKASRLLERRAAATPIDPAAFIHQAAYLTFGS
jgi:hypothetical protein